jgi:hypothetical protein
MAFLLIIRMWQETNTRDAGRRQGFVEHARRCRSGFALASAKTGRFPHFQKSARIWSENFQALINAERLLRISMHPSGLRCDHLDTEAIAVFQQAYSVPPRYQLIPPQLSLVIWL